mgnify:CR=1 FL=1
MLRRSAAWSQAQRSAANPTGAVEGDANLSPREREVAELIAQGLARDVPALKAAFGSVVIGLPAREGIVGLPSQAFDLLDAVYGRGAPLACWITRDGEDWRLTSAPRKDPETGEVYGVAFHLRERSDLPVVR